MSVHTPDYKTYQVFMSRIEEVSIKVRCRTEREAEDRANELLPEFEVYAIKEIREVDNASR